MWIRFRKDLAIFGSPEEFWRFCDKPEYQYWELSFDFRVVSGLIGTTIGWLRILGFCVAYKNTETSTFSILTTPARLQKVADWEMVYSSAGFWQNQKEKDQ